MLMGEGTSQKTARKTGCKEELGKGEGNRGVGGMRGCDYDLGEANYRSHQYTLKGGKIMSHR